MSTIFHKKNFDFLKNAFLNERLHHAYIFYGRDGVGKFSFTLFLARFIQCSNNDSGLACNECNNCKMGGGQPIIDTYIINN